MSYVYTFVTGLFIGALIGLFAYRNNKAKLEATEDKGKHLLDALKGK